MLKCGALADQLRVIYLVAQGAMQVVQLRLLEEQAIKSEWGLLQVEALEVQVLEEATLVFL